MHAFVKFRDSEEDKGTGRDRLQYPFGLHAAVEQARNDEARNFGQGQIIPTARSTNSSRSSLLDISDADILKVKSCVSNEIL